MRARVRRATWLRRVRCVSSRPRRDLPQAWHADYDYVATGEITQDGNGTISYDLTEGNGKERSSESQPTCIPMNRQAERQIATGSPLAMQPGPRAFLA